MEKIEDIHDTQNMTFTLNDSFTVYWKKATESGIPCRGGLAIARPFNSLP